MFYIKKETHNKNTVSKIFYDQYGNIINESPKETINSTIVTNYMIKIIHEDLSYIDFVDDFEQKTIFETEEEANQELSSLLENINRNVKKAPGENSTYSVIAL